MKIALIGYGKMGMAIEEIALQRGYEIVLKVNIDNLEDNIVEKIRHADVAIEFTGPESAFENIIRCINADVPVVCGSTGWLQRFEEAREYCLQKNGALLYASNFSIGVNIFFGINKMLAALIAQHNEYDVSISEIHHTEKKDSPSGTAITLAEQVLERIARKRKWVNQQSSDLNDLNIFSERKDPAAGTHRVLYHSEIDDIEIIHTAHNRKGFASGAVLAAEYICDKKGVYSMSDVLGI